MQVRRNQNKLVHQQQQQLMSERQKYKIASTELFKQEYPFKIKFQDKKQNTGLFTVHSVN